jgi:hypothetical protein
MCYLKDTYKTEQEGTQWRTWFYSLLYEIVFLPALSCTCLWDNMSGEHDFTPCCMRLCSFLLCLIRVFEITHPENMIFLLCCMRLCSFSGLSYTCLRDNTSVEHDFTQQEGTQSHTTGSKIMFSGHAISKTRIRRSTKEHYVIQHRSKVMFSRCVISKTRTRQSRKEHNLIQQGVKSCSPDMLSQRHV